jgi:hypothetical protein
MINPFLKAIFGVFFTILVFTQCCKEPIAANDISSDDYRLWSKGSCNRYFKHADAANAAKPIWAADYITTTLLPGDTLCRVRIETNYLSGAPYETLIFTNIPVKEKRTTIASSFLLNQANVPAADYGRYKNIIGFESPIETFDLDEADKSNHITFTKIDKENNRIEGTFDLAFYSLVKQDTLYFRNGTFVAAYPRKL